MHVDTKKRRGREIIYICLILIYGIINSRMRNLRLFCPVSYAHAMNLAFFGGKSSKLIKHH